MVKTKIQIRFADLDALGRVNNVNLQHYYDMGKGRYFQEVLKLPLVWKREGFIQANTNTNYFVPVYIEDDLAVYTKVIRIRNKSFSFFQQLVDENTGTVKSESTSVLVGYDVKEQVSIELLPEWREAICRYERENGGAEL